MRCIHSPLLRPPHRRPAQPAQSAPRAPRGRGGRFGFTLTELLVVIGIIILLAILSIPAFSIITGNRSIESAQNQLQAIIGRARQEAMGLQEYRGVLLFTDPNTGRICAAVVNYPDPNQPTMLGLAPSHDETLLPNGISFRTIEDKGDLAPINVLMFDPQGQFVSRLWNITDTTGGGSPQTTATTQTPPADPIVRLGWRIQPLPGANFPDDMPKPNLIGRTSAFGFVLFADEQAYETTYHNEFLNGQTTHAYLNDNGVSFMINRYSGTLLRTE